MTGNAAAFACNTYAYTLSHRAEDCLAHLADLGFDEFELMMYPGHFWPPDADAAARRRLRQSVEARGARIVTLNMPNIDMNVAGASAEMRRYTLDLLEGIVNLAGELGTAGVVIGPGKANPLFPAPRERLTGYFFAALERLLPVARKAGTALWVENMPFAFLPAIGELMDVLARFGADEIGIVYDAANGHFIAEDIAGALRTCRSRLKLVHLSDTDQRQYKHAPVGVGTVPFAVIPAALEAVGHRRRPVLEIIAEDADRDIIASADRLVATGFRQMAAA
ncbi:MAG: sugar phosphate isomerase/epimerase [Alphaproteobacteria bacterium]|nr:sugar phosphate isomerase/epimerase [Alphaproteobacteria bacterium]